MRVRNLAKRSQLGLELLESRVVPTTASLTNGVLTVLGPPTSGSIQITESNGQIAVSEVTGAFAASQVKTITVDPGDSDVSVNVSSAITAECWLFTGFGNDYIHGGSGKNHIFGGMGNDTLVGGSANDVIFAGTGHTTITAPPGAQIYNGPPYQTATISAIGQQIVDLVNAQRQAAGLAPLTVNPQLVAAAQMQSTNMASMEPILGENGAMSHELIGVPEPTLTSREEAVGYSFTAAGENIAYGYPDANSVMQAWMNSPGHRANILNSSFAQIGVAVAYAPGGIPYYTQEFGAPAADSPSGPPTLQNPTQGSPPAPPTQNPPAPPSQTPPTQSPPTMPAAPTAPGYGGGSSFNGQVYAVGSNAGTAGTVTIYDAATGAVKFFLNPYGNFTGGVRVAVGDLAGNGVPDVIVAPGPGMAPEIKVYNGNTGQIIEDFMAYDSRFTGGIYVAAGDLKGAGHDDIITGADAGGGPDVKAFDGTTQNPLFSFFAYDPNFTGGVRVAAGDVTVHGYADIITG
ncbi:MAG TPA: CAP domain-containing protein, partial [Gemmataceae bacterium]|nr:CAP domain-containing protein [Gemmataceae bacterium]